MILQKVISILQAIQRTTDSISIEISGGMAIFAILCMVSGLIQAGWMIGTWLFELCKYLFVLFN